jgi:hypothetical protein
VSVPSDRRGEMIRRGERDGFGTFAETIFL